jgi:TPP-dependent pyruvate/acetoin dehydrogenase alpha subunit
MEKSIREEVEHSIRFAEESPQPAPDELYTNVYANPIVPGEQA